MFPNELHKDCWLVLYSRPGSQDARGWHVQPWPPRHLGSVRRCLTAVTWWCAVASCRSTQSSAPRPPRLPKSFSLPQLLPLSRAAGLINTAVLQPRHMVKFQSRGLRRACYPWRLEAVMARWMRRLGSGWIRRPMESQCPCEGRPHRCQPLASLCEPSSACVPPRSTFFRTQTAGLLGFRL